MANETMRIFFPLKIVSYPLYDYSEDEREDISPREAVAYEDQILAAIAKENRHFENDRGLAEYIHDEALKEKVYSLYPSVEIVDGELWGVMNAGLKEPLSGEETAELLSFVEGQNADGYGEGFEQHPTELLICGNCGTPYKRVTWSKRGKKKIVWRCISRLDHGTKYCKDSPTIEEETLHAAILHAVNSVMSNRDKLIDIIRTNLTVTLSEKSNATVNPLVIENRIREMEGITMELVTIAQKTGDSESYESKFTALKDEIGALRQTLEQCQVKQNGPDELTRQIDDICNALRNAPFEITEYSNNVVRQLIDTIKVVNEDKLLIIFKGGFQMEQPLVGYEGDEMYEAS